MHFIAYWIFQSFLGWLVRKAHLLTFLKTKNQCNLRTQVHSLEYIVQYYSVLTTGMLGHVSQINTDMSVFCCWCLNCISSEIYFFLRYNLFSSFMVIRIVSYFLIMSHIIDTGLVWIWCVKMFIVPRFNFGIG